MFIFYATIFIAFQEADCSSVSGNSVEAGEVCTEATGEYFCLYQLQIV